MTKNILLVEDDTFLRNAYINILTKSGFNVKAAADGEEGLAMATANEPDLILLDLLMPKMDGIQFLKEYDVKNKHPKVKIVVFSNLSMEEKVNEAIELGAINYKTKAFFSPKEMIEFINKELDQNENQQIEE